MKHISEITLKELWGFKNLHWDCINEDVNILVGINGSGKSTLLNLLSATLAEDKSIVKKYSFSALEIKNEQGYCINSTPKSISIKNPEQWAESIFISTFDVVSRQNSKKSSPLLAELLEVIYTTGKNNNSFFDYRLKATNFPDKASLVNDRIDKLFEIINKRFAKTKKRISIDPKTNKLIFNAENNTIQLEDLSSGEKQFLLIIFKVFLMEEKPYILLMDEPEISLHINWQNELINTIRDLNPKCQIIISTHSPSIFGDGWGDKTIYMEDILE